MTTPEERTRAIIEMGREVMALAPYLHGKSETVRVPRVWAPLERRVRRLACWWFGCWPIYEAEHHGSGVMPCERCGAPDTTYADRVGDTRHARMVDRLRRLRWRLLDSWRPKVYTCPACGQRGKCKSDCDGIPF